MKLSQEQWETDLGAYAATVDTDGRLVGLDLLTADGRGAERRDRRHDRWRAEVRTVGDCARDVRQELSAYLAGELREFQTRLHLHGTAFQVDVWNALRELGYGETESYAALASRLGRPRSVRAVAAANGANPISVLVPCHRVIGADGRLVGYAGGLDAKRALLELEGAPLAAV